MTSSSSSSARIAPRRGAIVASLALLVATALMTPPAAQAAWTTGTKIHGGKAQVCKVRVDDGVFKIRLRLDNRNARHTHTAGLSRTRGTSVDSIKVRAGAGNVSSTKVLGWRSGDQRVLSVGMGETDGRGLGGGISLSQIPGC